VRDSAREGGGRGERHTYVGTGRGHMGKEEEGRVKGRVREG
jgi:hypothetical protein